MAIFFTLFPAKISINVSSMQGQDCQVSKVLIMIRFVLTLTVILFFIYTAIRILFCNQNGPIGATGPRGPGDDPEFMKRNTDAETRYKELSRGPTGPRGPSDDPEFMKRNTDAEKRYMELSRGPTGPGNDPEFMKRNADFENRHKKFFSGPTGPVLMPEELKRMNEHDEWISSFKDRLFG